MYIFKHAQDKQEENNVCMYDVHKYMCVCVCMCMFVFVCSIQVNVCVGVCVCT